MSNAKLLVIDDEPGFGESLADWFTPLGYQVSEAASGAEGVELALAQRPDAIILDILMPGMDGFAVIRALRENDLTRDIPIVVWSVTSEDLSSRLRGLRFGADYILLKSKELHELEEVLRRTLGRRKPASASSPATLSASLSASLSAVSARGLIYDPDEVLVYRDGVRLNVELTPNEASLMHCLWENRNHLTTRDDIAASVYSDVQNREGVSNEAMDRLVGRLRTKIEPDPKSPRYLQTVRGFGYRLAPSGQPFNHEGG
ncbi:response regulator transcription factor [Candidatus Amarolinea dominans]|uniref:response regulator transcription factor n=1 Tax=Candidatus Amarolinea dominans TaxID=3140696 RepID=UPI0031350918|nr:response regulator transcription factor [Anaerolineae bacterium]